MAKRQRFKRAAVVGEWTWRAGGPTPPVPAEVFAAELEKLAQGDPLELVPPDAIWQSARRRGSPLNGCFNWNLQEAAEAHWRDHARQLVGRLVMVRVQVREGQATSSRGWWSVKVDDRRGYSSEDRIMSDRDLRLQVMATAKSELHNYLAKYLSVLGSIGNVVPRLQAAIDAVQDEIDRLEFDAAPRRARSTGQQDRPAPPPAE